MAWPPTIPSNSRVDATTMATNHPTDHNAASDALTEIVSRIGNSASPYADYPDVETRFNAFTRSATFLVAHSSSTSAWKEAADLVIDDTAANNATDLNAYLVIAGGAAATAFGAGGGEVVFAPTRSDYYHFGSAVEIAVPDGVTLRFIGGTGKASAFFGSGSFDPTDVQVWFEGGISLETKTNLIFGTGTYIFSKNIDVTGSYVSISGAGAEDQTRLVMHSTYNSNNLIEWTGTNNSNRLKKLKITDIYFHGKDLGKSILYGIYADHAKIRDCVFYATGASGAPSTSARKAGIYFDGVWDSFIDFCRFEYCGTKGQTTVNSPPEDSTVRGALHVVSASSQANNIQVTNCSWENIGDCAYWLTGTSSGKANKCYSRNLKIEDHTRYNFPIIYNDYNSFCSWKEIDLTIGTPADDIGTITATDQWRIANSHGIDIDMVNFEPIDTVITGLTCTPTSGSVTTISFTGTTLTVDAKIGWTLRWLTGANAGTTKVITDNTGTTLTWSGLLTVANGDTFHLEAQNISSFIKFNGENDNITVSKIKKESKAYHYPTLGYIEHAASTDTDIVINGPSKLVYNPASITDKYLEAGAYESGERNYRFRTTTVNGTQASLSSAIVLNDDTSAIIEADVWCHQTNGSDEAGYWKIIGTYSNNGGTLSTVGTPTIVVEHKSVAAWDVDFLNAFNTVVLAVTGDASDSITWQANVKVRTVKA